MLNLYSSTIRDEVIRILVDFLGLCQLAVRDCNDNPIAVTTTTTATNGPTSSINCSQVEVVTAKLLNVHEGTQPLAKPSKCPKTSAS